MYAQIPPPLPTGEWTDWRAGLKNRWPKCQPLLLRLALLAYRLRISVRHLLEIAREVRSDPEGGLRYWRAHQAQEGERLERLARLRARVSADDFSLIEVSACFRDLVVKPDDSGQAEWFADAARKLDEAIARIEAAPVADPELFSDALKELRFLTDMPEFYRRYELTELEREVKAMYDALLQRLDRLTALKKEQLALAKDQQKIDLVRAEEDRLKAEQAKIAEENARVRELRQKLELEKERTQQKKILLEAEAEKIRAEEEAARQRAERERQEGLQKDYLRMQEEERLKVALSQARTLETQMEAVTLALAAGRFNPNDPIIRTRLAALNEHLQAMINR